MEVHSDFSQRVLVNTLSLGWVPSPTHGVDRRMLDRVGGEVARATSLVRYAPNSSFPEHTHGGGEEFIVLEGVFEDEHGEYPAGTYVRNPPTTSHAPRSGPGCTLFVKLWQFDADDRNQITVHLDAVELEGDLNGLRVATLHTHDREIVVLEQWAPAVRRKVTFDDGAELFLLDGSLVTGAGPMKRFDWLRVPVGDTLEMTAGPEGARLWSKQGHLRHIRVPHLSS